jgi:hypothetical protein
MEVARWAMKEGPRWSSEEYFKVKSKSMKDAAAG